MNGADRSGNICIECQPKMKLGQVFYWKDKDGTERRWSVGLAMAVIHEEQLLPDVNITRELATEAMRLNDQVHELDAAHVLQANLDEPLILITMPDLDGKPSHVIIDGWHRINKFVNHTNRQEPLLAYVLNEEQAKKIELNETKH